MKKRLKYLNQSLNIDAGASSLFHSRSYHRFFEDYTEMYTLNKSGKRTVLRRAYTGNIHRPMLTEKQFVIRKLLYSLLFAVGTVLYVSGALWAGREYCTPIWYTVVPQAATMFFLLWLLCNLFCYLTSSRSMTRYEYQTASKGMIRTVTIVFCAIATSALTTAAHFLFHPAQDVPIRMVAILEMLLSGGVFYVIRAMEKRVPYKICKAFSGG